MKYASNNIRNILIAGHAGSGKTTLTEALVYFSGAAERMGRVEDGTTISDFDPEEAKRKASLSASVVPVEYEGIKYNLIDAPGLFDFEAGEYEGIRAAESVLVCVSGRSGVTVGAEKAFQLARKNGKATMVFISKCDLENANYFKILEEMKIKFGSTVCPCVVPAKLDDGTPVYINLFSQKAFKYESGKQIQVELPDIGHRFQGLIEAMSEAIAETDDELMEKFFGGEPFTTEEIVEGMRKGVKDGLITPVFCGSAVNQQALDMLLFNMHKLLPSPQHDAAILAENASGEPVELHCDETEPTAAYVFKTVADPFVGKLSYLRVISGKVTAGEPLTNARTGDVEKIGKPLTVIGKSMPTPKLFQRVDTARYELWQPVKNYSAFSTGLAVVFRTDSRTIRARWKTGGYGLGHNMTAIARKGLDLYIERDGQWVYAGFGWPKGDNHDSALVEYMDEGEKTCLVYLPLWDEVLSLELGIDGDSRIEAVPNPFRHRIVVLGSSITHGASAGRPGMTWTARLARRMGLDFLNLGYSGQCKLQPEFARMLAEMDADAFVFDAFSNPSAGEIEERLDAFVATVRKAHPSTPLIFIQTEPTRPY